MAAARKSGVGPIVSSAHLADNAAPELSELEFALTIANNAFQRWIVRGTTAAGRPELGALDVLVIDPRALDPDQVNQVFSRSGEMRSAAEQRAYIEA